MRVLTLGCVVLLSVCPSWAQQDMGVITGVVTDATGAAVPGAIIIVVNQETNETRSTATTITGSYTVGPLRIGTYEITVEKHGFKKAVWPGLVVHAQDRVRVDISLDLGEVSQVVSVTEQAPLLQAETSSIDHVVGQREIRELPLNGRNFQQLAWLTAGVFPATRQELVPNLSATVTYVGSSSNYIMDGYNWNGSSVGPPATERQRRRIPQWNNINFFSPYGHASYHGLDVQLECRYGHGLSFSAAYTWSHSIDNVTEQFGSGGGLPQDFRNLSQSRGNSNFDFRHRFVVGTVYEFPLGKGRQWLNHSGWRDRVFGGWQLSNLLSVQTGHYFSITVPNPRQRLGATGVGLVAGSNIQRQTRRANRRPVV